LKQSQVVLHDKGQVACGHRRPLAFRRLTAILVPLSEDAIALCGSKDRTEVEVVREHDAPVVPGPEKDFTIRRLREADI